METMHTRLKEARIKAGYESASAASRAKGWTHSTYASHENGHRSYSHEDAKRYARAFRTTATWLLYGEGSQYDLKRVPLTHNIVEGGVMVPLEKAEITSIEAGSVYVVMPENAVASRVVKTAMFPAYRANEILVYNPGWHDIEDILEKDCVVQFKDGKRYIREVVPQNNGLFTLKSHLFPPMHDVDIEWAAPILLALKP